MAIDSHGNEAVAYEGERRRQCYESHQPRRHGGYDGTIERGGFGWRCAEGEVEGECPYGDTRRKHGHAHEVARRGVCGDVGDNVLADAPYHAENQHKRSCFCDGDSVKPMGRRSLRSFRFAFARVKNGCRKQGEGAGQKSCEWMRKGKDAEKEQERE